MLGKRVISAIGLLIVLFVSVIFSSNIFYVTTLIAAFIGLFEYFHAVECGNIKPMKITGMVSGLCVVALMYNQESFQYILPLLTIILLVLLSIPVMLRKFNIYSTGVTLAGVLYVSLLFGFLYLIRSIPDKGVYLIWFVFICSWFSDTFAYFAGSAFGKTKLCPEVSPHKTVEGSIGGVIGSTIGCTIYGLILGQYGIVNLPIYHLLIIGVIGSIISQFGDLVASSVKRNVGIKDYGKLIPGHGGILDRFDSILFVAPLIYYYITWII
jgi:CDP-diglyceride synthetase